jgi:hypothetical protein
MRKCVVLTFVVLTAAALPTFALAGEDAGANASLVQMSDEEMDNVTAAGNAFGHAIAPGQLKKQSGVTVQGGGKLYAPGQLKKQSGLRVQGGGKLYAPGQIKKGL